MHRPSFGPTIVIGLTILASSIVVFAQQGPATSWSRAAANKYEGAVSSIGANGFTITTRYGNRPVVVTTTDQTRYIVLSRRSVSSLRTGDSVVIGGKVDASSSTVAARLILLANVGLGDIPRRTAGHGKGIVGTIASTALTLTVIGIDGKTYTVAISARTLVLSHEPGTASDVSVGKFVQVQYDTPAASTGATSSVTASLVVIGNLARAGSA